MLVYVTERENDREERSVDLFACIYAIYVHICYTWNENDKK